MARVIVKLLIVALFVHAGFRVSMAYWTYVKFKDRVEETAQFAGNRSEGEITERVVEAAAELKIPINRDTIQVRKEKDHTFIDAAYTEQLQVLPGYRYPWEFKVNVDGWSVRPTKASDIIPQ